MCLKRKTFKRLNGKEGIGYKEVSLRPDGTFAPEYSCYTTSKIADYEWPGSRGVSSLYIKDIYDKSMKMIVSRVRYKIGRRYRVKHKYTTKTCYNDDLHPPETYPAGVYLYKHPYRSIFMLKCRYRKAVAEDAEVIVAMEIIPLEYGQF